MSEDDIDNPKALIIFGRDVSQMPCFRNSFLYGISGGMGMGFAYFMFSSRPKMSMHVGFSTFMVTTMVYWFNCRYNYSVAKMEMFQTQSALRKKTAIEGTVAEKEFERAVMESGLDLKSA